MANILTLSEQDKEHYAEIMKAFIDTAKSFTQVSAAALVLPIFFFRQLLALDPAKPVHVDWLLFATFLCFLIAIGSGLLYQYLAVKYLAGHYWTGDWVKSQKLVRNPQYAYACMIVPFYLGALFFMARAILEVRG